MVVLLNSKLYRQSYEHMKVAYFQKLIDLVLQFVRSVLIRLHPSLHFWKAMEISLLWVVVLLNFNVYSHTYECFKDVQVSDIHFRTPIWFWNLWGQFLLLTDAPQHAQLLATFLMDNSLDFTPAYLMTLQGISEKLNKIYVVNLNWQHQRTIDSFFKST